MSNNKQQAYSQPTTRVGRTGYQMVSVTMTDVQWLLSGHEGKSGHFATAASTTDFAAALEDAGIFKQL